jgi:hypothetical protein
MRPYRRLPQTDGLRSFALRFSSLIAVAKYEAFNGVPSGFHDFHDLAIRSRLQGPLRPYDSCELAVSGIPIQASSQ